MSTLLAPVEGAKGGTLKVTARTFGVVSFMVVLILAVPAGAQSTCVGCLGPNYPALMDTDGSGPSGTATPMAITPTGTAGAYQLGGPWLGCVGGNPTYSVIQFSNVQNGVYHTASRLSPAGTQSVTSSFAAGASPTAFGFTESGTGKAGTGTLVDSNGDGAYDRLDGQQTAGIGGLTFRIGLTSMTSGGVQYFSVPWSQVAALGVNTTDSCNLGERQWWVPTNNGRIILDLNGDGIADPQFAPGPLLGPAAADYAPIPLYSQLGLVVALLAFAVAGWSVLRSRPTLV